MNARELPIPIADEASPHDAAREAIARHLHLVIDADGHAKLVAIVLPGMQQLYVLDKSRRA